MFKDGESCTIGSGNCNMHPKALIIAGALIIVFNLLGMHSASTLTLWLSIIVAAGLIYAGVTGKCYLSAALWKHCDKNKGPTDTTPL